MRQVGASLLGIGLLLSAWGEAEATEAVAGRYVVGLNAGPAAAIVPPVPGVYWASTTFYYSGDAGRAIDIPVGDDLVAGFEVDMLTSAFSALVVPKVDLPHGWSYAFGITIPAISTEASAEVGERSLSQEKFSLGDITLTPFIFSWSDGSHFISASLPVTVPTGEYEPRNIAVIGMNYWTVTPTLAYTYLDKENNVDFSIKAGIDINSRNELTDYYSGAMAHLDATVTKTFENGFSVGVFGSLLYQIEDDDSRLADRLGGFRGRSFSVGPMLRYNARTETSQVTFSLSWAPEFGVENRLEGDAVYFNLSGKF